jgi:prepilin-type N-terminal cleavage/methylation domain-containing protein
VTRIPAAQGGDDRGVTLVEVSVGMAIMSVFAAIFTSAMLQVYRSVNTTESRSWAATQVQVAFQRLDKEIRYAKKINTPALVGTKWYVEYLTYAMPSGSSTGVWTCHAVRLNGTSLQVLSWSKDATPDPSAFATIMSDVQATDSTAGPFSIPAAVSGANDLQQLRLAVTARGGTNSTAASGQLDVTFTALNSSSTAKTNDPADTLTNTVCTQERQP